MNILVTGANGQLGQELRFLSNESPHEFSFFSRKELDITDNDSISNLITQRKTDIIINCAAYTNVDKAEEERDRAFEVNATGAKILAQAAKKHSVKLVHYSTDYVYHSGQSELLKESDRCEPQGVYGQSKLAGERAILDAGCDFIILRVSWLYSSFKNNFVKTMLKLGASRDSLSVVSDQAGSPTYARDLAMVTLQIIENSQFENKSCREIYNFSNSGITSWDHFAREIFQQKSIKCNVKSISTAEFGAKAPRPSWSGLSKVKIQSDFNIKLRPWQESLSECLEELDGIA